MIPYDNMRVIGREENLLVLVEENLHVLTTGRS